MNDTITVNGAQIPIAELERMGFVRKGAADKRRWRAEIGSKYWFVTDNGAVWYSHEMRYRLDDFRWLIGNYFRTREEAEAYRDKLLATQRVLDALREAEGDWVADWEDDGQEKLACSYSFIADKLDITFVRRLTYCPIEWYSSREAWESVLKTHEADVRLMMGVPG